MIGTALLVISLLLIALVVWAVFPRKPQALPMSKVEKNSAKPRTKNFKQAQSPELKQLVLMLHGDVAAAERLVQLVQRLNPAKDINWCIHKALTDLERDRRR